MLQNCSILKTAQVFFNEPTKKHSLKDISLKSKVAHTSTKQNLDRLKKLKIILEEKERLGKRIFPKYFANLESSEYKFRKRQNNLLKLHNSNIVSYLKDNIMPNSIVLFGSYERGEDIEESDIDIFIEAKEEEINLNKFERILNRKIELHFQKKFNLYPISLKSNIINGAILSGYLNLKDENKS